MSNFHRQDADEHADSQSLAEFLIPATPGQETQALEHIVGTLRQFGLEPRQMDHIMSSIDQSLQNLEGSQTPLHLRITVSGLDLDEMMTKDKTDRQRELELTGSGLGFLLIKRIVGRLQDPDPAKYRLLEVLIYRESVEAKE